MVPDEWSIYNILLNGHGKKVEDFAKATMKDWKVQVGNELTYILPLYQNVVIVAHSMGTLFAIQSSIKDKEKIKHLFLLAPPLKPALKPNIVYTSIKMLWGIYSENDLVTSANKKGYGIAIDKNLFKYIMWIPNYISLFKEIKRTNKVLQLLTAKTWVFFSKKDELVFLSSRKRMKSMPSVKMHILKHSQHLYYDKLDYDFLLSKFVEFCDTI